MKLYGKGSMSSLLPKLVKGRFQYRYTSVVHFGVIINLYDQLIVLYM